MLKEASTSFRMISRKHFFQRPLRYGLCCGNFRGVYILSQFPSFATAHTFAMVSAYKQRHMSSGGTNIRTNKAFLATKLGSNAAGSSSVRDLDKNLSSSSSFKVSRVSYDGTMYVEY